MSSELVDLSESTTRPTEEPAKPKPRNYWCLSKSVDLYIQFLAKHPFIVASVVGGITLALIIVGLICFPFNINAKGEFFRVVGVEITDDWDAYDDASTRFEVFSPKKRAQLQTPNRSQDLGDITLLFEVKDGGNIFDPKYLSIIQQVESMIFNDPKYSDYVLLDDTGVPLPPLSWSYMWLPRFAGNITAANTALNATGGYYRRFWVDRWFGNGTLNSTAIRAQFRFGAPLPGFTDIDDRKEDQQQIVGDWATNQFRDKLYQLSTNESTGLQVIYVGIGITDYETNLIIISDATLAGISIALIFVFLWLHTKSLFLAVTGLLHIVASFLLTYFFYRAVFRFYFMGFLNFMILFIVLGIGTDDIFLFVDAWKQSHAGGEDVNKDLTSKMRYAWSRAAATVFVTSLTTAGAFFCNAISKIDPIIEFAIYAGTVIIIDFLLVISWFPAMMIIQHQYLREFWCCCLPRRWFKKVPVLDRIIESSEVRVEKESGKAKFRLIEKFFYGPYTTAFWYLRFAIVIIFLGLAAGAAYGASTIQTSEKEAQFLPDDNNLQLFLSRSVNVFLPEDGFDIIFHMVWGISGIDRSRRDKRNEDDLGFAVFDPNFIINDLNAVDVQYTVLESCQEFFSLQTSTGLDLFFPDRTTCFMQEFKDFIEGQGQVWPVTVNFTQTLCDWKYSDDRGDVACRNGSEIVWFQIEGVTILTTSANRIMRPDYEIAEDYVQSQNQNASTPALSRAFQTCDQYVFMETERQLYLSAWQGLGLALAIILITLFFVLNDLILTFWSMLSILGVVAFILCFMVLIGWKIGIIESICITIVAGLSIDYIAHFAVAYRQTKFLVFSKLDFLTKRGRRTQAALGDVGISILAASVTTIIAILPLLGAEVLFFVTFSIFIVVTIGCATLWAFVFFVCAMFVFGPVHWISYYPNWVYYFYKPERMFKYAEPEPIKKNPQ